MYANDWCTWLGPFASQLTIIVELPTVTLTHPGVCCTLRCSGQEANGTSLEYLKSSCNINSERHQPTAAESSGNNQRSVVNLGTCDVSILSVSGHWGITGLHTSLLRHYGTCLSFSYCKWWMDR